MRRSGSPGGPRAEAELLEILHQLRVLVAIEVTAVPCDAVPVPVEGLRLVQKLPGVEGSDFIPAAEYFVLHLLVFVLLDWWGALTFVSLPIVPPIWPEVMGPF